MCAIALESTRLHFKMPFIYSHASCVILQLKC